MPLRNGLVLTPRGRVALCPQWPQLVELFVYFVGLLALPMAQLMPIHEYKLLLLDAFYFNHRYLMIIPEDRVS